MATRYSRIGALPQIILLILLIAGLTVGGLIWFDVLGLVDVGETFQPVLQLVGVNRAEPVAAVDDIMLMDRLRLEKLQEAVELREVELQTVVSEIESRAVAVDTRVQELDSREAEIEEREVSLNERLERYENRRAVLEQNSRDLTSMRPDDAVAILLGYDDQLLVETLRVTEELAQQDGAVSLVSVWLARFPAERAAELQRLMTLRPAN